MAVIYSLLTIVKKTMVRAGLSPPPATVIANDDVTVSQIQEYVEDTGRELVERVNWVNLDTAGNVTGDGMATLFQLPADWQRLSPSDKSPKGALVSNKYPLIPLVGPINTEDLNLLKALPASTVRPVWRIIGNAIEIWPALANSEVVTFNYYSDSWISRWDGLAFYNAFQRDDDFPLFSSNLVLQGAIWRFKASKGLDYGEDKMIYEAALKRTAGQQMTERVISTSRKFHDSGMFYGSITDLTGPLSQ